METLLLADNLSASEQVAKWYFDEWISKMSDVSIEDVIEQTTKYTSRSGAPMIVLAKYDNELAGAAQLKVREMDIRPEYEHWIGGVYVRANSRGKGVGSILVREVINRAKEAGISKLYLQTESLTGGMYLRHGFKPIEQVNYKGYDVLVMVAELSA